MVCKEALGIKIKTLRKSKKITQERLSEMIDVSPRHVVNIEMGYVYPTIEILQKIAVIFDVPFISFFEDEYYNKYYNKTDYIRNELHKKIDNIGDKQLRLLYFIADNLM